MQQVVVTGLKEFQAALKAADPKLARELTKGHRHVARTILAMARPAMSTLSVPKADEAAMGITARAGQRWAGIAMLGSNPFVRAVEFGTNVHHVFGRTVLASSMARRVFRPWRGAGEDAGYALYPTIRGFIKSAEFDDIYAGTLADVFAKAYPVSV